MTHREMLRFYLVVSAMLLLQVGGLAAEKTTTKAKTIRLLTVGNSFSRNATRYLPDMAKSMPGCKLILSRADVGGGRLDQHYKMAVRSEGDEQFKPYGFRDPVTHRYSKVNLKTALVACKWNIVTIQQYSAYSYKRATFEPWFGKLHAYIMKYAPQAKIYIHQTWAYRSDAGAFHNGFTQQNMYDRLTENYLFYAKKYHCPILPSGAAFQLCRQLQEPAFVFPDSDYDYKCPPDGVLPNQTGSLNVGYFWDAGKLGHDTHHANDRGCYLAGCTWFEVLFGIDACKILFTPKTLAPKDAAFLREIAHATASTFKVAVAELPPGAPVPGGRYPRLSVTREEIQIARHRAAGG